MVDGVEFAMDLEDYNIFMKFGKWRVDEWGVLKRRRDNVPFAACVLGPVSRPGAFMYIDGNRCNVRRRNLRSILVR